MPFITKKEKTIEAYECSHPMVDKFWFSSSLGSFDAPDEVWLNGNVQFKDGTRMIFSSDVSIEVVIGKVERYLTSIIDDKDIKMTAANYWERRCKAAESYIVSREHIPINGENQAYAHRKWQLAVELRKLVKPV